MKKLYQRGTVHPSPPSSQPISDHHLAFLPATILTLTVALSPQDKEVLAYLIACSTTSCLFPGNRRNIHKSSPSSAAHPAAITSRRAGSSGGDHPTQFSCNCFRCYMSYWVRWDSSPNRQLIHEIIDAFEDSLVKKEKNKKDKRKKVKTATTTTTTTTSSNSGGGGAANELPAELTRSSETELGDGKNEVCDEGEGYGEKGSVRKIVSFLGERIWGVWT